MAGRVAQLKKVKKSLIRTESGNEGFLLMEAEDLDEQIGLIEYRNGEVEVRKKTEYKKAYKLPDGWVQKLDKRSGRVYYANKQTRKTQWHPPIRVEEAEHETDVDISVDEFLDKPSPRKKKKFWAAEGSRSSSKKKKRIAKDPSHRDFSKSLSNSPVPVQKPKHAYKSTFGDGSVLDLSNVERSVQKVLEPGEMEHLTSNDSVQTAYDPIFPGETERATPGGIMEDIMSDDSVQTVYEPILGFSSSKVDCYE